MKLYLGLFLAACSLPVAFLVGFLTFQTHVADSFIQSVAYAALSVMAMLVLALVLFVWGIPSTLKRFKAQHQQGGV